MITIWQVRTKAKVYMIVNGSCISKLTLNKYKGGMLDCLLVYSLTKTKTSMFTRAEIHEETNFK